MIKVFESFDLSRAGQLQSLLEAHGIRTFLKNEFSSGALGELPFVEICPQLYVIEDADAARALLAAEDPGVVRTAWRCDDCGAEVDAPFAQCWQCGAAAPDAGISPTSAGC